MVHRTLMIFGPSGVGKTPLDRLVREDVGRIEPYRLRPAGPRNAHDVMYAPPRLREQLQLAFHRLGLAPVCPGPGLEWFPQAMTVFLKVRTEWQVLFLAGLAGNLAKAEIYAPTLLHLLEVPAIRQCFGELAMVILNPSPLRIGREPLEQEGESALLHDLMVRTQENCRLRGDPPDQVDKRAESVRKEIYAWRELIELGAGEYVGWPFPEYKYLRHDAPLVLAQARAKLVQRWPRLAVFFRGEV